MALHMSIGHATNPLPEFLSQLTRTIERTGGPLIVGTKRNTAPTRTERKKLVVKRNNDGVTPRELATSTSHCACGTILCSYI